MKKYMKILLYLLIVMLLGYGTRLKFQLIDSRDGVLNGTYVSKLIEVKDGVSHETGEDLVYLAFRRENSDVEKGDKWDKRGVFWICTPLGKTIEEGTYEWEEDSFYRLASKDGRMFGYVTFKGRHRLQLVDAEEKTMKLYHQLSETPFRIRQTQDLISQSNDINP